MKKLLYPSFLAASLLAGTLAFSTPARAETISQTNDFAYETPISGSANNVAIVGPGFFTASFNPWTDYGASNALTSFSITWDISFTASGVVSVSGTGGFNGGGGGAYLVNGNTYGTQKGGTLSGTAPAGDVISPQYAGVTYTYDFTPANAGVAYNPAILSDIMAGPILNWDATYYLNYGGFASGEAGALGSVVLTYTSSVPEPGSLALAGTGALAFLAWGKRRRATA